MPAELGSAAIGAGDRASGLAVLRSGALVDLPIIDVGLPGGMDGRQLAGAARPDLRALSITGHAEGALVGNGQLEPGTRMMTRSFAVDALAGRISDLLAQA